MEDPISIKFDGKRFDNHMIPLSMLSDLLTINKMVTDLASHIFLKKTGRQRAPKGFRDNVFLSLKGISEGSADACLEIVHSQPQTKLFPSQEEECILEAFGMIRDYISGNLQEPSKDYEKIISPYFKTIGRGLRPEESLSFISNKKVSILDNGSRHKLVTRMSEYIEDVELYGIVDAMDRHTGTFKVRCGDMSKSQRMDVRLDKRILPDVKKAFDGYDFGQKVYIRGEGLFKDQKLQRIEVAEEFQLLDKLDVAYRLNELQYVEDGWMEDGSGIAPDKDALLKLSKLFDEYYWSDTVLPYTYPTPSGNIEMEWIFDDRTLILKVDLSTFRSETTDTDNEDTTHLDLNSEPGWKILNDLLKEIVNE